MPVKDFDTEAAIRLLDIQETHREQLQEEPGAPENPGHPALDRPEHFYLVRLYHHPDMSGIQRHPWFIALQDDYENELLGGGETEAEAIATCAAGLVLAMTCKLDRPSETAARKLAAQHILDRVRPPGDRTGSIERFIAEIPDPDSNRARLTARLWKLLDHVLDREPDPDIGLETRRKVTELLAGLKRDRT